jgi:hypothetical protein
MQRRIQEILVEGADESPPQTKNFFDRTLSFASFSAFSIEEHWFRAKGFNQD